MSGFAKLKKSSSNSFAKLAETINKADSAASYEDKRFYVPAVDKAGNALVEMRFLPEIDGEDSPFVKVFSHSFKNSVGRWYIENCRTTIGDQCPVCSANSVLWNDGTESSKQEARPRSRRTTYIANVLIIKDHLNPENNGKNFLWKFGKKIYEKICLEINPTFGEEPCNVFDFWTGKNFKLKIRNLDGYRNYDLSVFDSSSALFDGDDKKIEELWNSQYSLQEFISASNFKSSDELDKKFRDMYPKETNSSPVTSSSSTIVRENSKPNLDKVSTESDSDDEDLELYRSLLA